MARRIAATKETFKANGIYPNQFMYDTGLLEELKDLIIGRRTEAEARAGGFPDWIDRLVEKASRVPGRALWREMKAGAQLPFNEGKAGSQTLAAFLGQQQYPLLIKPKNAPGRTQHRHDPAHLSAATHVRAVTWHDHSDLEPDGARRDPGSVYRKNAAVAESDAA
jgi:hypothetical protein